jgi:hypothetical protein
MTIYTSVSDNREDCPKEVIMDAKEEWYYFG